MRSCETRHGVARRGERAQLHEFFFFFSRFTRSAAVGFDYCLFWVMVFPVMGFGVAGGFEVDGIWLILSLIFGFVRWVSVGFGSISVGVWLAVGCKVAHGGLRGGSR